MPTLHIQLLNTFHLSIEGNDTEGKPITISAQRQRALLAYLLLHRAEPQPRQQIASALWPESTEQQARTNLRRELHHLRQTLPTADDFLIVDNQRLQWRTDAVYECDVVTFETALVRADQAQDTEDVNVEQQALERAATIYTGDLLPDCYDAWIQPERARLAQAYAQVLERLVVLLEKRQAYTAAIDYAQELLRHDTLREATYRHLMRLHAHNNDRARALRVYHNCVTTLRRELGVAPSPATREVHLNLLQNETASATEQNVQQSPVATEMARIERQLIGRQSELEILQRLWQQKADRAVQRAVHCAVVSGEAGIGKTRLVVELADWTAKQGFAVARTRAYAAEGHLAYAPIAEWLRSAAVRPHLGQLEEVWQAEIARLVPEMRTIRPDLPTPQPLSESWQRQRLFAALAQAIFILDRPLLLVFDDLQWADHETLEWLHYLLRSNPSAPLLIAGTVRPEEVGPDHPLITLRHSLQRTRQLTEIELAPLNVAETTALATAIAERELSSAEIRQLYAETEGNPLFIVETVHATNGRLKQREQGALPPQVQAVIEARLSQLSPDARALAELAATVGRSFSFSVLRAASTANENVLVRALDELWQRRIIREQNDDDYDFHHDKIREVAYTALSTANQRRLHRHVAAALETVHAADLDPVSSQMADHYARAGDIERAIAYYRRAGMVAQQIYAHAEATHHLSSALALLETQTASHEQLKQELELRLALATSLRIKDGYAAAKLRPVLHRARQLCETLDERTQLTHVLYGLFSYHFVRAELHEVYGLGEQLHALAEATQDATSYTQAHHTLGAALYGLGDQAHARDHLRRAISYYQRIQHRTHEALLGADLGVFCQAWLAHPLWLLGYADQALASAHKAIALAQELVHPFSHVLALAYAAMLHQFRREPEETLDLTETALAICQEQAIPYYEAWAGMLHGWAQAQSGAIKAGMQELRHNLVKFQAGNAVVRLPYYHSLLAELHGQAGDVKAGLANLDKAFASAEQHDEAWWYAELHRSRGTLLYQDGDVTNAEVAYQQAVAVAHEQATKAQELRAMVHLCRLWQEQGKSAQAQRHLSTMVHWFSEGFNTPDLQAAQRLLDSQSPMSEVKE